MTLSENIAVKAKVVMDLVNEVTRDFSSYYTATNVVNTQEWLEKYLVDRAKLQAIANEYAVLKIEKEAAECSKNQ